MKISTLKERFRNFRRTFKTNWLLFKESKIGVFGLGIIIFFVFIALLAPVLTDRDPVAWRAPEEDVIGIDKYWVTDLKLSINKATEGNSSITHRLTGQSFNPQVNRIYIGASNKIYALDPNRGTEIWNSPIVLAGEISTPIVAVNYGEYSGTQFQDYWVYLGTSEGYFYAINDTKFNDPVVNYFILDSAVSSISISNNESVNRRGLSDAIYLGTERGNLYAYTALNHSEIWNISLDGEVHMTSHPMRGAGSYPIYSPSLTQNGKILVVSTGNGTLHAISTDNHEFLWNYSSERDTWSSSPIIGVKEGENEVVYFGTDDGWLYAFYVNNGTVINEWKDLEWEPKGKPGRVGVPIYTLRGELDNGILTTPAVLWGGEKGGTFIFVGSSTGHFYKIARDGINETATTEPRPPGSTILEFKEPEGTGFTYRFEVQPVFYPQFGDPKYIFVIENHDNGTSTLDDDKGRLYAFDKGDLNISWRISEEGGVKFSSILGQPIAWASGQLADSVWIVTSDAVGYSYAASGKYLAPLPPGEGYILGTDLLGHDVFSQVVYGSRTALIVGFAAAFFTILIGVVIGLVSGYFGGRIDSVLMRFTDVIIVIPFLPFVIVLAAVIGPSIWNIIILIAILGWGGSARVIRSEVLSLKERPFIESARVTGASNVRIMFRHIAPNILPLAFLYMTFMVSGAILTEAALSFIGLGDFTQPSWGIMLFYIQQSNTLSYWWLLWPPGLCIAFLSMGFYLVGRAFEQIVNPRLRRRR